MVGGWGWDRARRYTHGKALTRWVFHFGGVARRTIEPERCAPRRYWRVRDNRTTHLYREPDHERRYRTVHDSATYYTTGSARAWVPPGGLWCIYPRSPSHAPGWVCELPWTPPGWDE